MKKVIFITIMAFALFGASNAVFAHEDPEYNEALKYYNSKNYQKAVELFKEYVKKTPDAAAYYRIGYGLYELKKYDEAAEYFKEAYLLDPNFSPEEIGLSKEQVEKAKKAAPPSKKAVTPKPSVSPKKAIAKKEPVPAKQTAQAVTGIQPQKPEQPKVAPAPIAQPEPKKVAPKKRFKLPFKLPAFLKLKAEPSFTATEILIGLGVVLAIIILVIGFIVYRKRGSSDSSSVG